MCKCDDISMLLSNNELKDTQGCFLWAENNLTGFYTLSGLYDIYFYNLYALYPENPV